MPKLGHFTFDKKIIARGFTSVVYKGIDEVTNKKVAIKCIDQAILDEPGKKKMLANQLSIQWQLKEQPYVVEIKGQFYQNDCVYIVSEFCQSGDLKNKIKEKGKFVQAKAVSYMTDIIRGFQTLFKHNIVHRDLKPSNIMISKKGIKIGDFGFAYKVKANQKSDEISLPSAGSPLYMAPQVLENGENSGYQSDIWSLGVVFFQMLTGRLPFPAKNKQSLIKLIDKIVIRTLIPESISPRSKQFLLRTLKKDPSKRMTPQQLINYEFDEEILYNIQIHRQRKMQQQIKRQEEGDFSTSSDDRVGSQEKEFSTKNNEQQHSYTHLHHHNPQVEKKSYTYHQSIKHFEPEKPPVTHNINPVPQQLISKKSTHRLLEAPQYTQNISTTKVNSIGFDNNEHKGKNLLDPHDIKNDRFKRKSVQKIDNAEEMKGTEKLKKQKQSKPSQIVDQIKSFESNTSIMNSCNSRQEDKKLSTDNSHHHRSHEDHSRSPQEMKKQEIIQILLNQVDIIRFFSRIMHKIEEIHHINTYQKQQRSLSQNSSKQSQHYHTEHPLIYTQLKQLIYKTILQIEKLQFLPDQVAYKFFRSEEFDQIKIILDTYKSKLNLSAVKSLQWKGSRLLEKELEKQILLIYANIYQKISKIESQHLQNDPRTIKKLNRKIQALDYLIVFRYDYLILQREEIFLNDSSHKNAQQNEKCSRIKQIIEQGNSKQIERNNLKQCCGELRKIEKVMKKIKLI